MAAFLGLIFLCRRRSRKSKVADKHRSQLSSDDESDIWTREKPPRHSFKGPTEHTRSLGTTNAGSTAPLVSRHSHDSQYHGYGPYPDRHLYGQTAPPAAQFGTDAHPHGNNLATNSAHPFSPDHVQPYGPHSEGPMSEHHGGNALAAGVGGAALGGLAAHAADRRETRRSGSRSRNSNVTDTIYSEDEHNTMPQVNIVPNDRRSGSLNRASTKELWPFMESQERRSTDSNRPRPRSMSRGRDHHVAPEQHASETHSMPSGAALAGSAAAGGLIGAAAAHKASSRSPHRKGILKRTGSNSAKHPLPSDNPISNAQDTTHSSGPHELESSNVPQPTRTSRERRRSPLGYAAPAAAIGANRSPDRSRRRSWSSSSSPTNVPPVPLPHEFSQDSDIPIVPSRSPRRNSLHSNARYSTANEGTVELPAQQEANDRVVSQGPVSPALEPHHGSVDNEGIVSPISPDTSLPGTWSKAQAQELGMSPVDVATKSSSQESTVVESSPLNSDSTSSSTSKGQSSGLVTAIQRIFNSPKQSWYTEEAATTSPPRRSFGDRSMTENPFEDNRQVSSVPHRKPAPAAIVPPRNGHYDEISQNDSNMPGSWTNETAPLPQTQSRRSGDSARSIPLTGSGSRYYARVNSNGDNDIPSVPAPATVPASTAAHNTNSNTNSNGSPNTNMNTARPRSTSRPGYGIGSGDPFDLARTRTDSNMTGISLINYVDPAKTNNISNNTTASTAPAPSRPPFTYHRSSSSSTNDYREPTLAELRREVAEEDRQRRMSMKSIGNGRRSFGSRKSGEGQRYGDDRELFESLVPGVEQYDHFYGQGYGHGQGRGVGTAY